MRPVKPTLPSPPAVPQPVAATLPAADGAVVRRRPRTLALELVDALGERIREGQLKVGDKLPDGSRVEAISSRGVTFIRGGRRFFKQIGGNP